MQTDLTVSPAKAFPDNFMDGLVMLYLCLLYTSPSPRPRGPSEGQGKMAHLS